MIKARHTLSGSSKLMVLSNKSVFQISFEFLFLTFIGDKSLGILCRETLDNRNKTSRNPLIPGIIRIKIVNTPLL